MLYCHYGLIVIILINVTRVETSGKLKSLLLFWDRELCKSLVYIISSTAMLAVSIACVSSTRPLFLYLSYFFFLLSTVSFSFLVFQKLYSTDLNVISEILNLVHVLYELLFEFSISFNQSEPFEKEKWIVYKFHSFRVRNN